MLSVGSAAKSVSGTSPDTLLTGSDRELYVALWTYGICVWTAESSRLWINEIVVSTSRAS